MRDKTLVAFEGALFDGATLMTGGFLGCGSPDRLIERVLRSGVKGLRVIANDTCFPGRGISKLIENGQVVEVTTSHIGTNPIVQQMLLSGELIVNFMPQGTLAEAIRAGGSGLGGVLTPTGLGTVAQEGRQVIEVGGKKYIVEPSIRADIALVKAFRADRFGNARMRGSARNMNPAMALAAKFVALECERLEELDPDYVEIPGVLVDSVTAWEVDEA